jgi:ABC-2 type transport system permease protein
MIITLINVKRYLKDPLILIMSFIFPIVMVSGIVISSNGNAKTIGVIDNDKSEYSENLISNLSENYKTIIYSGEAEENLDALRNNDVGVLYIIDSSFEKDINNKVVPKIKSYKKQNENGAIMAENTIDKYIKDKLEDNLEDGLSGNFVSTLIQKNESMDNTDFNISILMICYFMLIGSSIITADILKLKGWKVLKRTIVTPNSDKQILGGMFLGTFIIQTTLSSLAFIVVSKILSVNNINTLLGILVITLCSLVSTSLVIATTRWIKNPSIASLVLVIFGLISFVIGIVNMNLNEYSNVSLIISRLALISPFYWFIEILSNESLIKAVVVLILISAVFFTCGSFKLRDFVKED